MARETTRTRERAEKDRASKGSPAKTSAVKSGPAKSGPAKSGAGKGGAGKGGAGNGSAERTRVEPEVNADTSTGDDAGTIERAERAAPHPARRTVAIAAQPLRRLGVPAAAVVRAGERQAAGALVGVGHAVARLPRKQLALYAGLGAAAVVSVIEWPVAVAVAAGVEVARRNTRSSRVPESNGPAHPDGATAPEQKPPEHTPAA